MQFLSFVALALAIANMAAASPAARSPSGTVCCNSVTSAQDPSAAAILRSIGATVQDVNALVGLTCTSVSVIGDSASCGASQTAVNCQDISHRNLISVGCVPVTLRRQDASSGPQCCNTLTTANDPAAAGLIRSLGVVVQDVNALVGLSCTDVNVLGNGGSCSASKTEVNCENNSFGGLISVGCVPVTTRRQYYGSSDDSSSATSELATAPTSALSTDTASVLPTDAISTASVAEASSLLSSEPASTLSADPSEASSSDDSSSSGSGPSSDGQSDSAGPKCCNSVVPSSNPAAAKILSLLGVVVQDITANIGLTCTDVTIIGNSATCGNSQTQVNCQDNSHGNLISIGCVPVTL